MAFDPVDFAFAQKPGVTPPKKVERAGRFYKWKDDKGRLHYSETLPQEQEFETLELNSNGRVVRQIELHRDPSKQKLTKDRAEREREEKLAATVRQRDDALLKTYTQEQEIDDARERNVALPEQAIRGLEKRLSQAESSRAHLYKQAVDLEKAGEPVPPGLREDIVAEDADIARIKNDIERYRRQIISIRDRYDDDKRRFRELRGIGTDTATTSAPAVQ